MEKTISFQQILMSEVAMIYFSIWSNNNYYCLFNNTQHIFTIGYIEDGYMVTRKNLVVTRSLLVTYTT